MTRTERDLIIIPINIAMLFALMATIWGIAGVIVFAEIVTGLYLVNLFNFCVRGAYGFDFLATLAKVPSIVYKLLRYMTGLVLRGLKIDVAEQA